MNYYGISSIPHVIFDGIVNHVGASEDHANGLYYQSIIEDRLREESPLSVSVISYNFAGDEPYMTVRVEVFEDLATTAGTYLRVGVCEDNLEAAGEHHSNVLRGMPSDVPLTAQYAGDIQDVTFPLTIDSDWVQSEMWGFAMVQRNSDKLILNAGSTYLAPYSVTVETDGATMALVDGTYTFGTTSITQVGTESGHTLDISLDLSELPMDWDAYFTYDGEDLTSTTVSLDQWEAADLNVTMVAGDESDECQVLLKVHSANGEMADVEQIFRGLRGGADLLIVADDPGAEYAQSYLGPAIDAAGFSYLALDRTSTTVDEATMEQFDAVIWYSGDTSQGLSADDRDVVQAYLEGGGSMLLCGQDLAQETAEDGGTTWMINVLRTYYRSFVADGGPVVEGLAGDPISGGLSLNLEGGDGADNYTNTDAVATIGGTNIFTYPDLDQPAGTAAEYNGYKVIFLGFGFESINAEADRLTLMDRCLDWLIDAASPVADGLPQLVALHQNMPNPFNPRTTVSYSLHREARVQVEIYDVMGRRVRHLVDEVASAGTHSAVWNGCDDNGAQMPSGTYFCRMISGDRSFSQKMTLLK